MADVKRRRPGAAVPPNDLLIRQRMTALGRALAGARLGDVDAIHRARVATRRLREALPLMARRASARKLQRRVRRVTQALGPVRELDVAVGMLQEFADAGAVSQEAARYLRRSMFAERRRLHAAAVKAIDRWTDRAARSQAAAVSGTSPARTASPWRRAARRAERLRASIASAAGIYLPDRLHDVRIAVKKLRYTIELLHGSGGVSPAAAERRAPRTAAAQLSALRRAQQLLGRMHDLEVLIARTRGVQSSSNAPSLRISGELDRLVRGLEAECRRLHGHYMAARSGLLEICDQIAADARRADRRTSAA